MNLFRKDYEEYSILVAMRKLRFDEIQVETIVSNNPSMDTIIVLSTIDVLKYLSLDKTLYCIRTPLIGDIYENKNTQECVQITKYNYLRLIHFRIRKWNIDCMNIFKFLDEYEYVPVDMWKKLEMKLKQKRKRVIQ